jgi:hypothetical protein
MSQVWHLNNFVILSEAKDLLFDAHDFSRPRHFAES